MKHLIIHPLVMVLMLIMITSGSLHAQYQKDQLYVSGTVSSNENMLVTVRGTRTIEGNVVVAELNGKKTEMSTNKKGQAILNFSAISAGLSAPTLAVLKSFDKNGNLISTANTTVHPAIAQITKGPVLENLPANLSTGEMVIIKGRNLGADAKLFSGNQPQEILSASDREMTVFTNSKTGEQPVYVSTAKGVSESQFVNIYSLDFNLPKTSISPSENVQAMVAYKSIPAGTQLTFTNRSPQTIKMNIPGATNTANKSIYTIADKNGSMPVNITGLTKGDFTIALDFNFSNEPVKNNTGTGGAFDPSNFQLVPKKQKTVDKEPEAVAKGPCEDLEKKKENIKKYLDSLKKVLDTLQIKKALFDEAANGDGPKQKKKLAEDYKEIAKKSTDKETAKTAEELAAELENTIKEMEKHGVTDDKRENEKQSKKIKKDIKDLEKTIGEFEDALAKATDELDECLQNVSDIKCDKIEERIAKIESRIAELETEKKNLEDQYQQKKSQTTRNKIKALKDKISDFNKALTAAKKINEDCKKQGK